MIYSPIKSRFSKFRIPLFTFEEIQTIYRNHLDISMNDYLVETKPRNIIKALFLSEIERHPASAELLTKEFVELNFPPFVEFMKTFNKIYGISISAVEIRRLYSTYLQKEVKNGNITEEKHRIICEMMNHSYEENKKYAY
jgi:hypothetical protein